MGTVKSLLSLDIFFRKQEAVRQPSKMPRKKKKTRIEQFATTMTALNNEMIATREFLKHKATKAEKAIPTFMKEFKDMSMTDWMPRF